MIDVVGEAIAIAAARTFVSAGRDMIGAGVRRETVANALLAAAIELWSEARGSETVPGWLIEAAGLRSVVGAAAAETGGLH